MEPSQYTGIDMPTRPITISVLSARLPRVAAAIKPTPKPPAIHSSAAPPTSDSVTGVAAAICGSTFSPRFTNEVRSPVMKRRFISSAYCTGSGRSSPKSARTAASVSGVALRPAMRAEGSAPGVAKKIAKVRMLMPVITKTIWPRRRSTAPSITPP